MTKLFKKTSNKIGMAPGSLVHIGEKKIEQTRIEIIDYDEKHLRQQEVETIEECFPFRDEPTVTWINIDGLHEVEIIEKIGNHFDIHPLVLEDILHTGQRPKAEDFGKYIYIVLRSLSFDEEQEEILEEQISLLVGSNYVISFQERVGDEFNPVRERIRTGRFQMKKRKADFVAYSLIDAVVDNYFLILEKIGEKIESMERGESSLFHKSTTVYLKDVYDHTIQVIDTIETYRDMVSGMLDIYLSNLSNKMNEVMKVLTIIATIFIPLTFIAGIYGMNFEFMPELKWRWGYFLILGLMIIIGIGMVFYFQRKKWL